MQVFVSEQVASVQSYSGVQEKSIGRKVLSFLLVKALVDSIGSLLSNNISNFLDKVYEEALLFPPPPTGASRTFPCICALLFMEEFYIFQIFSMSNPGQVYNRF